MPVHGGSVPGRKFLNRNHQARHIQLMNDYFVERPLYSSETFRRRFRMKRPLFLRFSPILKVTIAMRSLAYAFSHDTNDENFRVAESTACEIVREFCQTILRLYQDQYLRAPTPTDLAILLNKSERRGFHGMTGSIDCMHWEWKNCPTAWQGSFSGRKKKPTIVLEAVASHDTWICHAFFGVPGALNDITVLGRSPLFDNLTAGKLPDVQYEVNNRKYFMPYYIADGIYPKWGDDAVKTSLLPISLSPKHLVLIRVSVCSACFRVFCAFGPFVWPLFGFCVFVRVLIVFSVMSELATLRTLRIHIRSSESKDMLLGRKCGRAGNLRPVPRGRESVRNPRTIPEQVFSRYQESFRKDVEQAFGILQARFAIVNQPGRGWHTQDLSNIMLTCIILHNMIMEDERDEYNDDNSDDNDTDINPVSTAINKPPRFSNRRRSTLFATYGATELSMAIEPAELLVGLFRVFLILYGEWQDAHMEVRYTDIDYVVFSDAASLMASGKSPYERSTYRYSPLLAFLLMPNSFLHQSWGKFIFSASDHLLQAAFWYGLVVHLRIYPIIYALPIILFLDPLYFKPGEKPVLLDWNAGTSKLSQQTHSRSIPDLLTSMITWRRIIFGLISGSTFFILTGLCFYLYGWDFLHESLLYHLTRTDPRHNFSVYFYHIYLHYEHELSVLQKLIAFLPQFTVQLVLIFRFAQDLPFCFFLQTLAFVAFNKVTKGGNGRVGMGPVCSKRVPHKWVTNGPGHNSSILCVVLLSTASSTSMEQYEA
ncbi:hypothetical protein RD792_013190 [Penstemon davidsonii]|uniref:GPI mannosyltransferase I n=1 Tax=Penstemon davidsonii TaxID=160366 RepID=A0ABR0CU99_9LAMI|nr:hypothetical protein RD792_013190 [Penstemon davidsonii]